MTMPGDVVAYARAGEWDMAKVCLHYRAMARRAHNYAWSCKSFIRWRRYEA